MSYFKILFSANIIKEKPGIIIYIACVYLPIHLSIAIIKETWKLKIQVSLSKFNKKI